jgi:hypothetical protein
MAPKIDTLSGFRIYINTHDHGPPYVHVVKDQANLRVYLDDINPPVVVRGKWRQREIREVAAFVRSRRAAYLRRWIEIGHRA